MNRISIGGIADTEEFVMGFGLIHLAEKKYPKSFMGDFHDMTEGQYWHWLGELNRANGWKHKSNFIAWSEYKYGGPKSLIGDLELFAEYMYDEYGVRVPVSQSRIKALSHAFRDEKKLKVLNEALSLSKRDMRRVSVVYEGHPGAGLLCREILSDKFINGLDGIELTLYNIVPFTETFTINLHDDLVALPAYGMGHRSVKVAKNLEQAVSDCDLLIFMGDDKKTKDSTRSFYNLSGKELLSLSTFWTKMGNMVNEYAINPEMRVVFTCMKYPCFNATFFIHAAPNVSYDLVVAVTSHIALNALVYLSRASGIPISRILHRTAHVWGSPGISHIVDLSNTDAIYNRPNTEEVLKKTQELKQEIKWNKGNPFNNMDLEDNFTWVKLEPVDLKLENTWKYVSREKDRITRSTGREPYVASIRATMEVLSYWYSNEISSIPVSVGICSNGGYGVPKGVVFSVPATVKDDHRRGWFDFHWCYKCRIIWNMNNRPRWQEKPCNRPFCAENPTTKQICYHHRNPDIFEPFDPFLNIDGIINTIITVLYELDGTGEVLSKILDPEDLKQFMNTSGKLINAFRPQRPLVDDYAAKVRKELHQLREEWYKFVGKNSYLVQRPMKPILRKLKYKKSKRAKLLKKKKKLEKLQQYEEEEEERRDYETIEEEQEQEAEVSAEELSVEERSERHIGESKSATAEEETDGEGRKYVLKRRLKEEQELEEQVKRVIEAITDDDIPIMRLYPNAPDLTADMLEQQGDKWVYDRDLWKKAEQHFDELGDERPSTKFLREFYAKRLAKIEYYCKEVVPKEYGHLYCTHTKAQHKKMKEECIQSKVSLLPYPPPFVVKMEVNRFVPPERELGEDDWTYRTRWVEARVKYNDKLAQEYIHSPEDTLYYGQSCVKVKIIDQENDVNNDTNSNHKMNREEETGGMVTSDSGH